MPNAVEFSITKLLPESKEKETWLLVSPFTKVSISLPEAAGLTTLSFPSKEVIPLSASSDSSTKLPFSPIDIVAELALLPKLIVPGFTTTSFT